MSAPDPIAATKRQNLLTILAEKPGMILGGGQHSMHRIQAFIEGLKWRKTFNDPDLQPMCSLLESMPERLKTLLPIEGDEVAWFDQIMGRNAGNEERAFQELMSMIMSMAKSDGIV